MVSAILSIKAEKFGHQRFSFNGRASFRLLALAGVAAAAVGMQGTAHAQAVASACTGVSLPPSVVTGILAPVVDGIVAPTQTAVNGGFDLLQGLPLLGVPLLPDLSIDAAGLLANAAAGQPITLSALDVNGNIIAPGTQCNTQSDTFSLTDSAGVAFGGNQISGLGDPGALANAGEINSIAIGNNATTDASALRSVAIGTDAVVSPGITDSVALGSGSVAARGPVAGSAGEVSVGAVGAERQITNVAAGTAATDAANVGQVQAVADQVGTLSDRGVLYDTDGRQNVTLEGVGGSVIANLADGAVTATSTEAINGSQLFATNQNVAANTAGIAGNAADIANLAAGVANGSTGPVQYANPGTSTVPNGGTPTNNLTLVGAANAPVVLGNVADGVAPTDAANVGQVQEVADGLAALNDVSVNYTSTAKDTVALGGAAGTTITNVADGAVAAGSTDAVNGGQLFDTNTRVTGNTTAIQNLATSVGLTTDAPVVYDGPDRNSVTLRPGGGPATLGNVANGVAANDAVNVGQFNNGLSNTLAQANAFTETRIADLAFDLSKYRDDADAGTAGAMAIAGLPQTLTPGGNMVAMGVGTFRGESAFAIGASTASDDGNMVFRLNGTYNTRGDLGASAGVGFGF